MKDGKLHTLPLQSPISFIVDSSGKISQKSAIVLKSKGYISSTRSTIRQLLKLYPEQWERICDSRIESGIFRYGGDIAANSRFLCKLYPCEDKFLGLIFPLDTSRILLQARELVNANGFFCILEEDGTIFHDEQSFSVTGWKKNLVPGENILDCVKEEHRKALKDGFQAASLYTFEFSHQNCGPLFGCKIRYVAFQEFCGYLIWQGDSEQHVDELSLRLSFYSFLVKLSRKVNENLVDFSTQLTEAMAHVCGYFGSTYAALLINLPGLKDVYVGCKPQKIRFSDLKWFQEECQKKEHVFFLESLRQCIKAEPKEKQFLRTCGFRSCLVIPLRDSGKLIGILFVSVEPEVVQRFQKMLEELGIVGNIFGRLILKERLLQSQLNYEKDRQANFSKLELVSSLGHEMRTPLMGITGLVDALEDCSLTSAQQPLVSGIRESAHQIIKFLREVEDLSRMEAGEVQLKQEKFNPYELVLRVSKSFEPELNERGMSLDIHVSRSVPDVFSSDSQRFVQILFNLMQNALEHADHGVVRVTLAYSDTKDMLFLSVSDSGPGITAEQQAGLFQKFVRLNSIKIGSGVGLAITHHLVKLLGGEIDVEAIEGKGTVFSVSIPNCVTSYPLISEDFDYDVPAQNILFVDDNSINQKIAENLLQISGHNVDIAENGFEALQKLNASENYDMVFMDLQMPVMDGFTAIRAIRGGAAGRKYSTIPIVAVTAGTHANDFEECHECGADEVLVKPFEAVRFRKLVADFHFCRIRTGGCAGFHAIFDKESALLKMGADEEVLQEALELFLDEAKSRWEEIQIAVDSKDPNQLRFMLHSLRGVSSSLGFEALEQQCLTISELLKSGNIEYAFKLAGSLESLYFDTVQQVKKQG